MVDIPVPTLIPTPTEFWRIEIPRTKSYANSIKHNAQNNPIICGISILQAVDISDDDHNSYINRSKHTTVCQILNIKS